MTKISFSIFILACAASIAFSQQIQSITEEQDYAFCYGLHKDGQYQLAYEELEKFLLKYPNSAKRADAYFLSGECLFALNQFTGATQRYESFLTNFPNSLLADDALFRLGEIAYTSKNYQNAATTFKRVLDKYSDSDLAGEAAYWIGESSFKLNEFRDALKFYQVSYELYPNNRLASYALYSVGWTHEQTKEYKKALESFQQLPAKFPQSELTSSARVRVGECYYHLKDYRKAIEYLTLSRPQITQENELAEADYLIGESYYNVEDYLNALFKYEDFLKNHKGHRLEREVKYSLGWTYLQEKNYEKPAALFDELAQGTDELAHASLFRKGIAQKLGGQKAEARATFMICSQANGAYSDNAMYEIGLLQYDEKNYKEAKASFTKVTKDFPSSDVLAQSYRMLGETNLMLNAYSEAREAFKAASSTKDAPRDVTADAEFQEAWSLIKLKQYDEAAAQFAQFVKSYPQNSKVDEAYFWLGEAYFNAGNFQQSATNYNQVVNLYPKSSKFVEALYGLGWSNYKMGEFAPAVTSFEQVIQKQQKKSQVAFDANLRLGDCYFAMKDYKAAAGVYRSTIRQYEKEKGIEYAYYQLAQCSAKADDADKALDEYSDFISKFPSSELADDAAYGKGWVYFQQKDYSRAIQEFQSLLKRYPKSELAPRAQYSIGDAYYNVKDYTGAIVSYNKVLNEFPNSPYVSDAITGAQYCYVLLGRDADAARVVDEFLQHNPQNPSADKLIFKKAELLYGKREYEKAIQEYRSFIQRYQKSALVPDAHYWIGKSYRSMSRFGEAVQAFNTVVTNHSKSALAPVSMLEVGLIYVQQNKFADAVAAFDRLEQEYPESEPALRGAYEKGAAYLDGKMLEKAESQFASVAEKKKATLYGDKSLVGLGIVQQTKQAYAEAIKSFTEVATRRTDDVGAEAQYRVGETLFLQQQYKDAVTALLRVKYVFPSSKDNIARAYLKMGECYEKLSDKAKAQDAYQVVLKSHKDDEFGREAERKLKELRGA